VYVIESEVVLRTGPGAGVTGDEGFDFDFPPRKISRKVGEDFGCFFAFIEAAKS
jgi:hypothetical protein